MRHAIICGLLSSTEPIVAAWLLNLLRVGDWCEIGRGVVRAGWRGAGRREGSGNDRDTRLKCMRGVVDAGRDVRGNRWWRAPAADAGGALTRTARTPIATPNAKTRNDFIPTLLVARGANPAPVACSHIPPGPGAVPPTASHAVTRPYSTLGPSVEVTLGVVAGPRSREAAIRLRGILRGGCGATGSCR